MHKEGSDGKTETGAKISDKMGKRLKFSARDQRPKWKRWRKGRYARTSSL